MAKKHKHPEHENLERWLVSYADFMTLLFATFTALYALSLSDVNKLKSVAEAISAGFEEQSILHGIKTILQGQSPPSHNPDPVSPDKGAGPGLLGKYESMTYKPGDVKSQVEIKKSAEFAQNLAQDAQDMNREIKDMNKGVAVFTGSDGKGMEDAGTPVNPVEATIQERGIRLSFDSRLLFPPGAATVRPAAYPFLSKVAERLKKYQGHMIHIEGHTDNQGIGTAMFPSNWELSGARASSVVRYFIDRHHINPSSLVSVGYGSTQPVASNDTAEGRTKNRRVDILIYNARLSADLNPRLQALKEKPILEKEDPGEDNKTVTPGLPYKQQDGPVKVILKDKDGNERILIPQTKPAEVKVEPVKVHQAVVKPKPVARNPMHKLPEKPVVKVPSGPPVPGQPGAEEKPKPSAH